MQNNLQKINAVDIYLVKRKSRQYVGRLSKDNANFIFIYDDNYLYKSRSIALGPDLPLTKKKFESKTLFPSFLDRLPSKQNPAYEEYCKMVGIDPSEKDQITLIATLGRKGPSSFIFTPATEQKITHVDIINYRKKLSLTVREFGELFDFSPATVSGIENKAISGKEALKRFEIYINVPEAALYEINKNRFKINEEKIKHVQKTLKSQINQKIEEN